MNATDFQVRRDDLRTCRIVATPIPELEPGQREAGLGEGRDLGDLGHGRLLAPIIDRRRR